MTMTLISSFIPKVLLSLLFVHATCLLEYSEFFVSAKISVYHIEVTLIIFQREAPGDFEEGDLGDERDSKVPVKAPL